MTAALLATAAAAGVYLVYTELALGWRGFNRRASRARDAVANSDANGWSRPAWPTCASVSSSA